MEIRRGYKILLRLYPPEYRAIFGKEMVSIFEEASEERRTHGYFGFMWFVITELIGLLEGAGAEWITKFTSSTCQSNRSGSSAAAYKMLQKMRPPWVTQEVFFKAIDLIDEVGGPVNVHQNKLPSEVIDAEERIEFLLSRIVDALSNQEFEKARSYSDLENKERGRLHLLRRRYRII